IIAIPCGSSDPAIDKVSSATRPDWELAVESIDLPTRSSAFRAADQIVRTLCLAPAERQKCTGCQPRRCLPADLRHTIETAHGCQLRKLAHGSSTYVR